MSDPATISRLYGAFAAALSLGMPVIIWWIAMRQWRPASRITYAARFSLWPALLFSTQLGGPLARQLLGLPNGYGLSFSDALQGFAVLSLCVAPFAFGVGYVVARFRLPDTPATAPR